jgi:hypothetical protein
MPDARWRVLRVGLAIVVLAQAASAQGNESFERRLDSLAAVANAARARVSRHDDSVSRVRAQLDSTRVGVFTLRAQPTLAELARDAASIATADLQARLGAAARRISDVPFVLRAVEGDGGPSDAVTVALVDSLGVERAHAVVNPPTAASVAATMRHHGEIQLARGLDGALKRWLFTEPRFDTVTSFAWTQARVELVSAPSGAARRCYEGDLPSCHLTVGLRESQDPVRELLDSAGRHQLVRRHAREFRFREFDTVERCLRGDDAQCIGLLDGSPHVTNALSPFRLSLLQLAMQIGGPDAIERAFASSGSPSARLAAIAGVPADTLVRRWQERVRTERVPSEDMDIGIAAASLAWFAVFGALAMRSTRWR